MNTAQVQLKVSISQKLSDLLQSKAKRLGVPVTQFVKHLILKEVEEEEYPIYQMSERTEKIVEEAMDQIDQAVDLHDEEDIRKFFKNL